jgi:hypothetical protein
MTPASPSVVFRTTAPISDGPCRQHRTPRRRLTQSVDRSPARPALPAIKVCGHTGLRCPWGHTRHVESVWRLLARPKVCCSRTCLSDVPRHAYRLGADARSTTHAQHKRSPETGIDDVSGLHKRAPEGIRTPNLLIRSQMLYPLSYGRRSQDQRRVYRPVADRLQTRSLPETTRAPANRDALRDDLGPGEPGPRARRRRDLNPRGALSPQPA